MAKGNWRDGLGERMFSVLKMQGTEAFLGLANDMLDVNPGKDKELRSQVNGEICEIVVLGLTQQYLKLAKAKGSVYHSVVLKDLKNPKGDFRTELDFVLVTPYFFLTSECKSYYGDITVTGNATLSHFDSSADVYRQSRLHHQHLMAYAQQLVLPNQRLPKPPVFANAFLFSKGNVIDKRTPEQKKTIRISTTSTVIDYYEALFKKYRTPVFDYERACLIFKKCAGSVALHKQHKQYLGY